MGKYIRALEIKREFDGDNVKFLVRTMDFGDLVKCDELLIRRRELAERIKVTVMQENKDLYKEFDKVGEELARFTFERLPTYIERVEGLTDAAGAPIEIAELFRVGYFAELISGVFGEWRERSTPSNPPAPGAPSTG